MKWFNGVIGIFICTVLGTTTSTGDKLSRCIFDEIQSEDVHSTVVNYDGQTEARGNGRYSQRIKRQTGGEYEPIRIIPYYSNIEDHLNPVGQSRLRSIISAAILKISRILSVIPVRGPLLLSRRDGCKSSWSSGINAGKCSQISNGYYGEKCGGVVKIPNDHLEGLYIWDDISRNTSTEVIQPGQGVSNSDYILYVLSQSGKQCQNWERQLIAYAFHCRLDQIDRPVAGYVNFCPDTLQSSIFDHEKYYLTAIHELFHALGFSRNMFQKYKGCSSSDCTGYLGGVKRLIMPAVVRETQQHFGCLWEQDFGPPLEVKDDQPKSHWHPRFLQGSIMSPTIGQTKLTFLDNITLALFEDTGWYQVNYAEADLFKWGKGEGCEFGLEKTCKTDSDYFCIDSGLGCHYTHLTKARCETDNDLKPCRIYMANKEENCTVVGKSPTANDLWITGEEYGENSRCFLSNLTHDASMILNPLITGKCFQYSCLHPNVLMVRTSKSNWLFCPPEKEISVPGYRGTIHCPRKGVLCTEAEFTTQVSTSTTSTSSRRITVAKQTLSTATTSASSHTSYDDDVTIHAVVVFPLLDVDILEGKDLLASFVERVLMFVLLVTNITERRLKNVSVHTGSVQILFDILPAHGSEEGPSAEETFDILLDCVEHGNFTVQLPSLGTHRASEIRKRSEMVSPMVGPKQQFSVGGIVGVVLGAVALLVGVVVAVLIINKYKLAPPVSVSPSPRRTNAGDLSVVYTRGEDSACANSSKSQAFTDLEQVVSHETTDT